MLSDKRVRLNLIMAFVVTGAGVFLDQLTKYLAVRHLVLGQPKVLIPDLLNFGLVRNKGAAFGIGSNWDPFWHKFFFIGLSSVAILLIAFLLYKSLKGSLTHVIAWSFVLAGAIGNIYDRIVQGTVVDFIEAHYKQYHWPNFNIADSLICVGVGLYILEMLLNKKEEKS